MKTSLFAAALLATLVSLSAAPVATHIPADRVVELNEEALQLLSRPRISTGIDRAQVIEQLGEPDARIGNNVWAFTQFRAGNMNYSERYDTLLVTFKDDKVERITLSSAKDIRTAIGRSNAASSAGKIAAGQ